MKDLEGGRSFHTRSARHPCSMMIHVPRILILVASCLTVISCLVLVVLAADFSGPVVSVLDGNTVEVLHNTNEKYAP